MKFMKKSSNSVQVDTIPHTIQNLQAIYLANMIVSLTFMPVPLGYVSQVRSLTSQICPVFNLQLLIPGKS